MTEYVGSSQPIATPGGFIDMIIVAPEIFYISVSTVRSFVQEAGVASIPTVNELKSTIARLESRYRGHNDAGALFEPYEMLCRRFERDLADERDRLLSKAAAMMMIKYSIEQERR
ncbi:hypothetical protein [Rhizobium bangladeshense]|uniref:hypothetical protein n=1 Tax=Rhizobium bangladeshense TaxID=1138189 RepID=UPI000AE0A66F|nr:hypothetical protein [Rhizobium bangladeshense]